MPTDEEIVAFVREYGSFAEQLAAHSVPRNSSATPPETGASSSESPLERAATANVRAIETLRGERDEARAEVERLREAVSQAYDALEGGDGPPDTTTAQMWLRTTFRTDHPNYVDPAALHPSEEKEG